MKATERIKIITEIAEILGKEDWSIIDLTLRQFNLPTSESWSGNSHGYIVEMMSSASDEALIELAEHYNIEVRANSISSITPEFWKRNSFKLFLSHISAYKVETAEMQKALNYYGISAFVAHEDIVPTKEWQSEIETALETMDGLIALLTPKFHESNWTDQEIGFAIGKGVPIIPVRLGLDPYGFIGKYQGMQGLGKTSENIAKEIVEILIGNSVSEPAIISGLIYNLKASSSYAESKEKIDLIEKASYISPKLLTVLDESVNENDQVKGSWGVPEKIEELKRKFTS